MYMIQSSLGKALLFLGMGIAAGVYSIFAYQTATESESWPSTTGEITLSKVDMDHNVTTGNNKTKWKPRVKYSYEVNASLFENDRIGIGIGDMNYKTRNQAQRAISQYPAGKKVQVYYDPANPQTSALETGVTMFTYLGFFMSIILILAGLKFLLF